MSVVTCRECGGTAPRRPEGGFPRGWYGLTVSVPEWYSGDAGTEPYIWVGMFCSAEHLLAYGPEMLRLEILARLSYEAAAPAPAASARTGIPPGRKGPRP